MNLAESILRKYIRQLLKEGVYDPGIFKAVFMAGGPGSGKSHTAKAVFGGDVNAAQATATASGLKLVNSDPAFEMFLKKAGVDPADLGTISPEEFEKLTVGKSSPRSKAKRLRDAQRAGYLQGNLGIVVDGTGDDYAKIAEKKAVMEDLGYDTMMLFVNTSLEVAQERNRKRDRKLPDDLVEEIWQDVQQNMGSFQTLFGRKNFIIVDNTVYGPLPEEIEKAALAFVKQPVQNSIGQEKIQQMLSDKGPEARLPKQRSN
jgi:hypothetical protein